MTMLVREDVLSDRRLTLSATQLEMAFTDSSARVRKAVLRRPDVEMTQDRIHRALADSSAEVVLHFLRERRDWTPNKIQTTSILNTQTPELIDALLNRPQAPLTQKQLRLGMEHENERIRVSFLKRRDSPLSASHVAAIFESGNSLLISALLLRECTPFSEKHKEQLLFESTHSEVLSSAIIYFLESEHPRLTPEDLLRGMRTPHLRVFFEPVYERKRSQWERHQMMHMSGTLSHPTPLTLDAL